MSFRKYIELLAAREDLITVNEPISTKYEIAAVLKELEPQPVLFENLRDTQFRVLGNLFPNKSAFADYFNLSKAEIILTLAEPACAMTGTVTLVDCGNRVLDSVVFGVDQEVVGDLWAILHGQYRMRWSRCEIEERTWWATRNRQRGLRIPIETNPPPESVAENPFHPFGASEPLP